MPKSSPLYQNLISDKSESLSGLIRSCMFSYSGALGTFISKHLQDITNLDFFIQITF